MLDVPKKAVPVGTVPLLQLLLASKSLLLGLASQVAFCARAGPASITTRANTTAKAATAASRVPNAPQSSQAFAQKDAAPRAVAPRHPPDLSSARDMTRSPRTPPWDAMTLLKTCGRRQWPNRAIRACTADFAALWRNQHTLCTRRRAASRGRSRRMPAMARWLRSLNLRSVPRAAVSMGRKAYARPVPIVFATIESGLTAGRGPCAAQNRCRQRYLVRDRTYSKPMPPGGSVHTSGISTAHRKPVGS